MKNIITWTTVDVNDEKTWPEGSTLGRLSHAGFGLRVPLGPTQTLIVFRESGIGPFFIESGEGPAVFHGDRWAVVE